MIKATPTARSLKCIRLDQSLQEIFSFAISPKTVLGLKSESDSSRRKRDVIIRKGVSVHVNRNNNA